MANFERVSYAALAVIPQEKQYLAHSMYEDNDLKGAEKAEALCDYLEQEMPGQIIGILANDSVTPPCCNQKFHYDCDFYAPHWFTVLVSKATWDEYRDAVMVKDQEWKAKHGCKAVGVK